MPRTIITGGAGFIGSHLTERLIDAGHNIIVIDNLITGNIQNLEHIKSDRLEFIKHDICNEIRIAGKIDFILHFASPASPIDYLDHPIPTLKVGSLGTHKALGLAKEKQSIFMLASTSEVYGDPLLHPQNESYWGNVNPIGPRGVYDEAKRFAEALTMAYHRFHNVNTRIIRIFNTFGPRMRLNDGRVVPNFIVQALTGKPLTVYGDGSQSRSFCYVTDLVDGIIRLLSVSYHLPVNLGNPAEMTIMDFAKEIIKHTSTKSEIIFKPLPEDDPKQRQPDISLAKNILDWEPKVNLNEGLKNTLAWFKSQSLMRK